MHFTDYPENFQQPRVAEPKSKNPYTKDEDDRIRQGVYDGESYGVIARELGRTRSSVIGRGHRLGLSHPSHRRKPKKVVKKRKPVRKAPKKWLNAWGVAAANEKADPPAEPIIKQIEDRTGLPEGPVHPDIGVKVAMLNKHACKWPIGDPKDPDFRYCMRFDVDEGDAYCRHHEEIKVRQTRGLGS